MKWYWWVVATCVPIAIIAVATAVIVHRANPPITISQTSPSAPVSTKSLSPVKGEGPPSSPATRETAQAELRGLRDENARLVQIIHELREQQEADRAKASAVSKAVPPSSVELKIEDVESIGKQLAPAIEAGFWKTHNEVEKQAAKMDGASHIKGEYKISVKLSSVDLVRTDSVINPIVGEIVFSVFKSTDVPNVYNAMSIDRYSVRVTRANGEWRMVSGIAKCETDSAVPRSQYGHDRTGETTTLGPDWLDEEFASIRAGKK